MTAGALILPDAGIGGEIRRWSVAAAFVLTAHAVLLGGYLLLPQPEPDGALASPAVVVEFAPIPVAPSSPDDIALGPEMVEAQPASKPPPQIEPELIEPTPKMDTPALADVTLPEPKPKAAEKKPEENPGTQKIETKPVPQLDTPAPRTTAAPRSDQRTAAIPRAPSPGSGQSREATLRWQTLVAARLQQNKRYPAAAEARHEQGVVTLSFTVDRDGRVLARNIARSSGHAALDEEVLAMIQRAQPLPAFLPGMDQRTINLTQPIRFSAR